MAPNEMMNRFRLASPELFNHFFHVSGATGQSSGAPPDAPAADGGEAWDLELRFSHVEEVLFEKLVCEPARLTHAPYGSLQSEILVELEQRRLPDHAQPGSQFGLLGLPDSRSYARRAPLVFQILRLGRSCLSRQSLRSRTNRLLAVTSRSRGQAGPGRGVIRTLRPCGLPLRGNGRLNPDQALSPRAFRDPGAFWQS